MRDRLNLRNVWESFFAGVEHQHGKGVSTEHNQRGRAGRWHNLRVLEGDAYKHLQSRTA